MPSFIIDGNIGSGKSTILNLLSEQTFNKPIYILKENTQAWNNLLQLFYKDMNRYAFSLQMMILKDHIYAARIKSNDEIWIVERSFYSCIYVFGKNLLEKNLINQIEYDLMINYVDTFLIQNFQHLIYLDCDPNTCYERIQTRDKIDTSIPLDYIKDIDLKYKEMINNDIFSKNNSPKIHVINSNRDMNEVLSDVKSLILSHQYDKH